MSNPFIGRLLARVLVIGGGIVLKSAVDAFRHVRASGGFQVAGPSHMRGLRPRPMNLEEAKSVLGLKDNATAQDAAKVYERMFNANEPSKGGSFYIQSKIYRARETIEKENNWNLEEFFAREQQQAEANAPPKS
ncbi:mitochondrial presequence translocase-assisted motor (PAM complex) Tim16 subunit (Pam16) [Andalucia godoyi]|uniref:Mitochondrial presequence translocase-assisted motor (PAM complex) Tim16 subunit (Pam16) n=1 Tax=Andalucia godoyi TaxID=505711 RepID=A0A8K0AIV7_ANDGO|nr:mitochondrial presequence translocase-assisted motor (PAM complex) Tim16 subunit (Pam16) [Andalucia godoyi]|eukprot:ANDGO_05661.mRNA.1 mitochondrial presequence translocase-assisted motor (PAM complex) Tim16 subunit (Pam16)